MKRKNLRTKISAHFITRQTKEGKNPLTPKFTRIYYLAHPLTTHGNMTYNRDHEAYVARKIREQYPDITLLRPLITLSPMLSREQALSICDRLLSISDTIIFASDEWRQSKGCMYEYKEAVKQHMQVLQCVITEDQKIFFNTVTPGSTAPIRKGARL